MIRIPRDLFPGDFSLRAISDWRLESAMVLSRKCFFDGGNPESV